jgi:hypothetical protein
MRKIRDVLRLSAEGLSTRQMAASLAIGRTTLRGYLDRADELGLSWPLPPSLSDTDLERQITPQTARDVSNRATQPDWAHLHRELRRKGVTLSLLWEEYRADRFENGKAGVARGLRNGVGFGSSEFYVLRPGEKVLSEWLYRCVTHEVFRSNAIPQMTGTGGLQRVPRAFVEGFKIPLPPLEVQREIVAEVESYQRVIDGARAVLENYRPHIPVDPEWPIVELGEICDLYQPRR